MSDSEVNHQGEQTLILPNGQEIPLDADGQPDSRQVGPQLKRRNGLPLFLFLATCLTTYMVGGFWYMFPVMSILLAHEFGHFLQAVRYGVPATWPYFIPMPAPPLGTMGAVIVQGAGVANRKACFDIAITGPLAGLVLALPITWYAISQSDVIPIPAGQQNLAFGEPLILQWMVEWTHGDVPDDRVVVVQPYGIAGWVGIFITALNLIPIGQLDGGHILYTLIGRRAHLVAGVLIVFSVSYMVLTSNYFYVVMLTLITMMGPFHPPTEDDTVPLGLGRIILGWLTLSFIVVGFTPIPLMIQ